MREPRVLLKRSESYVIYALIDICKHPGTSAAEVAGACTSHPPISPRSSRGWWTPTLSRAAWGAAAVGLRLDLMELSLLEVIETLSGPLILDARQAGDQCVRQECKDDCKLKDAWIGTTLRVRSLLGEVTFAQLCDRPAAARDPATLDAVLAA